MWMIIAHFMTRFEMKSKILAFAAVLLGCLSCVENDSSLGSNLIPLGQTYKFYTATIPLDNIELVMADSLSGYSSTRATTGSVRDSEYGLSTRACALTLVPIFKDSMVIGDNPVFKNFRFAIGRDTLSSNNPDQKRILQSINVYELEAALDEKKDFDCNKKLAHGSERITKGVPVYNGGDSLTFSFNEEFGRKFLSLSKEDFKDYDSYSKKMPGIYIETEDPAGEGGRINMFNLQLGFDSDSYYFTGNYAKLNYSAEFEGERRDTSILFYYGANKFHNMDSLLTTAATGSFPQYALNLTSQQTGDKVGKAGDKILIEGGGGLKPLIRASELKRLAEEAIMEKGGIPSETVINKASLVFPFEFPDDYTTMQYWPQVLYPTCRIVGDEVTAFMGLTDSSSDYENQGDINRSILNYAPDITYHLQELLKIDETDTESTKTKRFNKGSYDIWLLIMANETITTTSTGNQDLSDMYNYLAYQSYYNSMYGGYGYGSGYGSYYSNYYSYAMMAAYASSSSTSTSVSVQLDKDRFYKAALNGPDCANGRVPELRITFAIPDEQ